MKGRFLTFATFGAAIALLASTLNAGAAAKPSIEDPLGDANFINDQGTGDGSFGDFNQADAGSVSDITNITFSNDAKNVIIQLGTEAAPPAATGIGFRVRVNPDSSGQYCISFEAYYPGANNALSSAVGYLIDECAGGDPIPLKVLGTQWTVARSANKAFVKGAKLTAPQAQSFLYSGNETMGGTYPVADTTKVGTDYTFKK